MIPTWACPMCHADNRAKARACEHCGHERVRVSIAKPAADPYCTWTTAGLACRMPAGIGTKRAHCTWHSFTIHRAQLADAYDEFERWVATYRVAKYCCAWTHYPASALWEAVRGVRALDMPAIACASSGCPQALAALDARTLVPRAS